MNDVPSSTTPFKVVKLILAIVLLVTAYSIYDQHYLTIRKHDSWGMVRCASIGFLDIRPISVIVFTIGFYLLVSAATTHTTFVEAGANDTPISQTEAKEEDE